LATNRLDLPAELSAEMYRLRWVIEMFFRTFKQLLGCRHLLSNKHNGVEIQAYCAMIVCMLILIYTGERPNRAMYQRWSGTTSLAAPASRNSRPSSLQDESRNRGTAGLNACGVRRCAHDAAFGCWPSHPGC